MTKKLAALAALVVLLLTQRPHAQGGGQARIYFVDIGTGASTLIVSPTGKTLLVDGGPPGSGAKISSLLTTLGIATIDYTVITHYHIDHMGGLIEVLNAGKVAGVAYDNGDGADVQPPGTSTSSSSTRGTYLNYVTATGHAGVTRQTGIPGSVIDLGGGMHATFVAAGGRLLSGGSVAITNEDLNSESISTLIEYNDFDYLVSGDLTGGGSTSTAKTPDVETYVAQMVGDVDVVQLDHHGSTTANNQTFLSALKAEVAFAQTGETNTFGHPNRETANKFLNTPDTTGTTFGGAGVPPATGVGPVFYQNEASPAGDDRVTQQGYTGAAAGHAGQGTVLLATDGTTTYSMSSFDDGGVRINPNLHTYAVDGVSPGLTADFKPTVVVNESPSVPLATESVLFTAAVNDRESPISGVTLAYSLDGIAQPPVAMTLASGLYQATIPAQPDGTRVEFTVTGFAAGQNSAYSSGYFSGMTPIASLRTLNALGEPLYNGYAARVEATVTATGYSAGTNDDYAQDATGAINVYRSTDTVTPFTSTTPGEVIEARGRVGFIGGRLRLDLTESVEKTTSPFGISLLAPGTVPTPLTTTLSALSTNTEALEGQLVSIANVSRVSGTFPTTPQSLDAFVVVTDGTANFTLKIDHDTDIDGFVPGATFDVIGVVQQDDYLRPFDSGYNVAPRSALDLGATAPPPPPLLTIAEARVDAVTNGDGNPPRDTIPDLLGHVVTVRGAVTSIDLRGGTGIEYYVQDATGGIDLFSTSLSPSFNIGDNVEATGTVTQFNGLTELTVTAVSLRSTGSAPAPQVVTLSQLADGVGEALEGRLIRVDNVTVTAGTFGAAGTSNNVTIADATGTGILRIDSDTDIDGSPTVTGTFSLVGLASQFDTSAPFDSGYQIITRSLADITPSGPSCSPITIGGSLANGVVGTTYSQTLTATGGTAPYTFTILTGSLPAGLQLSGDGVVSGTPTLAGTSNVTILAAATGGCSGSAAFPVTVTGVLTVAPPSVDFGSVATGSIGATSVTITNTSSGAVTLNTPFTITGADASQFTVTAPGTTALAGGASTTAALTFLPTTTGPKNATLNITSTGGGLAAIALTGSGTAAGGSGSVVISEIRFRGPLGGNDEFVEIYNNSDNAVSIAGWKLMGSSNTAPTGVRATVPANIALPARSHYLFVNTAASGYSAAVPGNLAYTTGFSDNGGVALTDAANNIIDQVGVLTINTGYREGTPIATQLTTSVDRGWERKPGGLAVTLQDTNDNATDFQLTTPSTPQNIVLLAAPATVDFGTLVPPGTVSQPVTIRNLLTTAVTLNAPAISGTDAGDFAAGAFASTSLAGGTTTTVTVTFQPAAIGHKSAMLVVSSSLAGAATVPLTGNAITGISVSPPSVDFGTVPPGSTTPTTLTIENTDPVNAVTLTPPFAITGTDASAFSVGAPGTTFLGGADSTPLIVSFQPATPGPKSATLQVTSVQSGSRSIPLSGLAACPAITVSGTPPAALVGISYTTAFTATGGISPYTFSVANGTPPPGLLLHADGTLSGNPTAPGTFTFTVQAAGTNGCTGSTTFTIAVTVPVIPLTAAPTAISFGSVLAPATATQTITLTNNTSGDLTLNTPLRISGPDASQFSVTSPASTTLAAATSTTAVVTFAPTGPGARTATLTVASSGGGLATVSLSGNGASPVLISEIRFRGPAGGNDEFVEIYNNSDTGIDISGWKLMGSSNTAPTGVRATVAANVVLAGRSHYLFVNTAANGYSGTVAGNKTYTTGFGDNGGVALTLPDSTIVDQVGVTTINTAYREGTPIATQLTTSTDRGYERKAGGATVTLQDTDDNSADFQLTTPSNPQDTVLAVSPATLDFGSISQLTTHTQNVTVTNVLTTAVTLNSPTVGGADATEFAAGAPAAATLAAGEATTITVAVHSSTTGLKNATLSITSSGGSVDVPLTATVTGDTTVPVLTLPADITLEATGAATVVTYSASAIDAIDGPVEPVCTPASGAGFAVGSTTVNCTATDPHGNGASGSFNVTITDHTPPAVTVPGPIAQEATGPSTPATFMSTASDLVDGSIVPICTPASGFAFPLGTTPVTCTATDAHGNSASGGFSVTVTDHTAPVLSAPSQVTTPATTAAGALVTFTASAIDLVDGGRPVSCVPASGSVFALGTTAVACSTADLRGNAASASFNVLVTPKNPKPPKVTAPKNIRVEATGPTGAVVTFVASATDPFDGTLPVTCAPASGSMFPLGATLVTCSATNSSGLTDTDTAIITVRDTTDPTIVSLTPSATVLPNTDQVVPVSIAAVAVDIVDPSPVCRITGIAGGARDLDNDGLIDWTITGTLTVDVQAVARRNADRTYTITVKCTDASGNASKDRTAMVVSRAQ
jgi:beta-lactamase superfamily II metal-dependent hydrolase/predicted extracellular nuclease